ncbi:hypothetical protein J7L13_03550 [bacterium]|nr:hypothetical protein [bacterium]
MREKEPVLEAVLTEREKAKMTELVRKAKQIKFNESKPQTSFVYFLTPAEHYLLGSTWPGIAFHPNLPLACLAGKTLEEVNSARQKISQAYREGKLRLSFQGGFIVAGFHPEEWYELKVQPLPLSEDQLKAREFSLTFKILSGFLVRGEDRIPLKKEERPEVEKRMIEWLHQRQQQAQEELKS